MHAPDPAQDVMELINATPVPTSRSRPAWVHPSADWTDAGEIESGYVPLSERPSSPWWLSLALAATAALTAVTLTATTVLTIGMLLLTR